MILMNDFKAEPPEIKEAMLNAVCRVLNSGWYVLGDELKTFEKQWAEVCDLDYAVGVGNGMDAIEIVLRALDIKVGDEVITTPMTAFASVLAIHRAGATPVLADVEFDTGLLSIESATRCLTSRTKAVLIVHLYGQVRQMDAWSLFCSTNGIALIEDCAQAHLAEWHGKVAGSFGEAGAYSFYPTKNLGALGDAGMVVTNNKVLADRSLKLRNYGQSERYYHPEIGMNSRLDEMQAALLGVRLKWLSEFTEKRRKIANLYRIGIKSSLVEQLELPEEPSAHVYHLYVIKCQQREALVSHLHKHQIDSQIHYPIPVHHQKSYKEVRVDPNGLPNSERHASLCLSLPCHPQMSIKEAEYVIDVINAFSLD